MKRSIIFMFAILGMVCMSFAANDNKADLKIDKYSVSRDVTGTIVLLTLTDGQKVTVRNKRFLDSKELISFISHLNDAKILHVLVEAPCHDMVIVNTEEIGTGWYRFTCEGPGIPVQWKECYQWVPGSGWRETPCPE